MKEFSPENSKLENLDYNQRAQEIIRRFKSLLAFVNSKYADKIESTEKINLVEFKKDMEKALREMEEIRTLNNDENFHAHFYEFSSFMSGGIHDIRNAVQFMLDQHKEGKGINFSYLKRFVNFADFYADKENTIDFIAESQYFIFAEVKDRFKNLITNSLKGINYQLIEETGSADLELQFNETALYLLFNELATNFHKYGRNAKVEIIIDKDSWKINWENDLKNDSEKSVHSTNQGKNIIKMAVEALGGQVIKNDIVNDKYYFEMKVLEDEE